MHPTVITHGPPENLFRRLRQGNWTGTIKKLVPERGFGFVQAQDGKEFFFHVAAPIVISIDSGKGRL